MLHAQWKRARRRTVGADEACDVQEFIDVTRELGCTPHVAQNLNRPGGSAIDGRTTGHAGYAMSQRARPRIEPAFGTHQRRILDDFGVLASAHLGAFFNELLELRLDLLHAG